MDFRMRVRAIIYDYRENVSLAEGGVYFAAEYGNSTYRTECALTLCSYIR